MAVLETAAIWVGVAMCALATVPAVARLVRRNADHERWALALLGGSGLLLGLVLVSRGLRQGHVPAFGRFEAVTFYAVALLLFHVAISLRYRMQGISAFVAPFASFLLLAGITSAGQTPEMGGGAHLTWLGIHAGSAFMAYALCALSGILATAYLLQDHNLKRKQFGLLFERLPSLEGLDHMMSRQIGAAFFMLTVSLVSALHLVRLSGVGLAWLQDPKTVATVACWGLYAVLMHMRTSSRRHGKGMAWVTIFGLLLVLFSFLGIRAVSDSMHNTVLSVDAGQP